jgi:LacI family transcriptional regulator
MKKNEAHNVGIKDIADVLKVSIGTVDRALHGRPGVSARTKERVVETARRLGYQPNLAAQALKLNRRLSVAAVLPRQISQFFDPLRAGIRSAAAATTGMQVGVTFYEYPHIGTGELEAVETALKGAHDGIILAPGDSRRFAPLIRRIARAGIATMCVSSDAPNTERIGSVAVHSFVSGAIAAELLAHKLPRRSSVAIFSGQLSILDHAEKLRGFAATLALLAPHLSLLPAQESHDRPRDAHRQALNLMQRKERPDGLYISTANSLPVLDALGKLKLLGKIPIIATDLFEELVPFLERGEILATIYQRPFTQGKQAFESLLAHLIVKDRPTTEIRLAPHVIFRSNLPLFSRQIPTFETSATQDDTES